MKKWFILILQIFISTLSIAQSGEYVSAEESFKNSLTKIKKSNDQELINTSNAIFTEGNELRNFIDQINEEIILISGGYDENGWMVNPKDKDGTNRVMIEEGKGDELEAKINSLVRLSDDLTKRFPTAEKFENFLETVTQEGRPEKKWSEFVFKNMPIGALQPIFTKLKNDVLSSQLETLNFVEDNLK